MQDALNKTQEHKRLESHHTKAANWKHWGPYLSERGWGTVREDYSFEGEPWLHFPHEHAHKRTYRWNEDGIAGISDRNQYLCFALALWNGKDTILKERMFGLSGYEGNHGEDVKEYYFYLDNTPTHSYMKMLYKYPQKPFPYQELINENSKRGFFEFEYELLDTGIFDQDEYFDVFVEYAKASEKDILIEITLYNRADQESTCYLLPTLWFRNTWSWGYPEGPMKDVTSKPLIQQIANDCIKAEHVAGGTYYLYTEQKSEFLFTENETNQESLYQKPNSSPYVKDAFHRYLINHEQNVVNPQKEGTKAAALNIIHIAAHGKATIKLRLSEQQSSSSFEDFDLIMKTRKQEADEFYDVIQKKGVTQEEKKILRQAFAGLLWSKQLYYYDVEHWDQENPKRKPIIRNHGWQHLVNFDIISMPDKWEYPWYASWDLAFHCIALVLIDPDFAKRQLILMTREWYMHPNGQLPAYEWNFFDVNPPVHAWAALRVYQIDAKATGKPDFEFLQGIFHKLLLNFTWWVNRKDKEGNNVFQGGFLGLDNISLFDRSKPLPTGGYIDQADGTAWMAFYCVEMMKIALELALEDPIYQDSATKFFEHFQRISFALNNCGRTGHKLWNDEDQFFYDALHLPNDEIIPLKVRSLVGLLPLFAVESLDQKIFQKAPIFERRMDWFSERHPNPAEDMACVFTPGEGKRRLMAISTRERLIHMIDYLSDENEFLSDYGIRSLSKYHKDHPYRFSAEGSSWEINYQPAESQSGLFGGNSNWRGPIWFPINFLIIEALNRHHSYYGNTLTVEFPKGSGQLLHLNQIAANLTKRLIKIFLPDTEGKRPVFGGQKKFQTDPYWKDYLLFYEYFHGDNGAGIGASHQTGWTGLITNLIQCEDEKNE